MMARLLPQRTLLADPIKIMKPDGLIFADCPVQIIYQIKDGFIHVFNPAGNIYLPAQGGALPSAGQAAQLRKKLGGFLLGNKSGGGNGIRQQTQLCGFKCAAGGKIYRLFASAFLQNIQAALIESLDIFIDAFPLGGNPKPGQVRADFLHGEGMGFICFAEKDFP